jgi:hypothetical protein
MCDKKNFQVGSIRIKQIGVVGLNKVWILASESCSGYLRLIHFSIFRPYWIFLTSVCNLQVIAAEGEQKASRALKEASDIISESPAALQLRYRMLRRQSISDSPEGHKPNSPSPQLQNDFSYSSDIYCTYQCCGAESRGAEIKLPPGAGAEITNRGSGSFLFSTDMKKLYI